MSKARNAGEIALFVCLEGCARQWLIFIGFVVQHAGKVFQFLRMSRVKRSFWKPSLSLFVNVSWKTLVVQAFILTFCECLVYNARFGN